MEETTLEFYKERGQLQENRILELQQRRMDSNINEQSSNHIVKSFDLSLRKELLKFKLLATKSFNLVLGK